MSPPSPSRVVPEFAVQPPLPRVAADACSVSPARGGAPSTPRTKSSPTGSPELPPPPPRGLQLLPEADTEPTIGASVSASQPTMSDLLTVVQRLAQEVERLKLQSSHQEGSQGLSARNPTAPSTSVGSNDLASQMTQALQLLAARDAKQEARDAVRDADSSMEKMSRHWRNLNNLISAAPKFDGSQDVELWTGEMLRYLRRNMVGDATIRANVIIGALQHTAREWFGSLGEKDVDDGAEDSILTAMEARFGRSKIAKLRIFNDLKQRSGETVQAYADRLRKSAYGLSKDDDELIYKFYCSISLSSQVYDHVVNLPCSSLQQAVEYVEKHSKYTSPSLGGSKPAASVKCGHCGRMGHTKSTCRQLKRQQGRSSGTKGGANAVEEDQEPELQEMEEADEGLAFGDAEELLDLQECEELEEGMAELLNVEGDIDSLGKRSNSARDEVVKKLRTTPANPNVAQGGGYVRVPVTPLPTYKSYTLPKRAAPKLEPKLKETMEKPVAVPMNQYMGLTLLASQDKSKLVNKLTKEAAKVVESYSVDAIEVTEVTQNANATAQTMYLPILLPGCAETQWALVDTGAQVSLITTGVAKYCNVVAPDYSNLLPSELKLNGVTGAPWGTARLATDVTIGQQRLASRQLKIQFAVLPGDKYKIILGMDVLMQLQATVNIPRSILSVKFGDGEAAQLKMAERRALFKTPAFKNYFQHVRQHRPKPHRAKANAVESQLTLQEKQLDAAVLEYAGEELQELAQVHNYQHAYGFKDPRLGKLTAASPLDACVAESDDDEEDWEDVPLHIHSCEPDCCTCTVPRGAIAMKLPPATPGATQCSQPSSSCAPLAPTTSATPGATQCSLTTTAPSAHVTTAAAPLAASPEAAARSVGKRTCPSAADGWLPDAQVAGSQETALGVKAAAESADLCPSSPSAPAPLFAVSCLLTEDIFEGVCGSEAGDVFTHLLGGEEVSFVVENHRASQVDLIFYSKGEVCNTQHAHKIEVDRTVHHGCVINLLEQFKCTAKHLLSAQGYTDMRNCAVRQLLEPQPSAAHQTRTAEELSAELNEALPQKNSPTSLGNAALEPAPMEELSGEELERFLALEGLRHMRHLEGIGWRARKLQVALEKNPQLIDPTLSEGQKRELRAMLLEVAGCLATRIEDLHRPCDVPPVDIHTTSPPIKQKPYKLSPTDLAFLQKTIDSMLEAGVLIPSSSPWAAPVFVVYRNSHDPAKAKPRKVVDYRKLNSTVVDDSYPLPDMTMLFNNMAGACYFGALDLKSGFWQVPLTAEASMKTAFTSPLGLYQYTRMPFGYKNAPSIFMRLVDQIITKARLRHCVAAFVDDITTHGYCWENYLANQKAMLQALERAHWLVTVEKIFLGYQKLEMLGHFIEDGQIFPLEDKVDAIKRLLAPTTTKQVKSFLGLVGFYRRFIKGFAKTAAPLIDLLKGDVEWRWGDAEMAAFKKLKKDLQRCEGLFLPLPGKRFRIYTDFSAEAVSAILHQVQEHQGQQVEVPICFASRTCKGREKQLGSAEGELLACVFALTKFKQYVGLEQFDLITDSRALCALRAASNLAGKLARWSFFLQEFRFRLIHRPGATLHNADGLSRCAASPSRTEEDAINLENIGCLETPMVDDVECLQLSATSADLPSSVLEVSLLQRQRTIAPCSKCHQVVDVAEEKGRMCVACGEVQHARCMPAKPKIGYWFCPDCKPQFIHGHADPALDLPLHHLIRGLDAYPGSDSTLRDQLRNTFSFVRGQLVMCTERLGEVVVPAPSLREELIQQLHEELLHPGWEKTLEKMKLQYWWPGMVAEVRRQCKACLACQLSTGVFKRKDKIVSHLRAAGPREAWSLDLAPGLKTVDGARAHIVVCVDDFSKFVVLDVIRDKQAATLKEWFVKNILGPYGRPLQVRTDRGNEFAGDFASMLTHHNVRHMLIRPQSPWTNGRAERMVRTVKLCISKVLLECAEADWRLVVPYLNSAINCSVARSTGLTPSEVFFGSPCRPLCDHFPVVAGGKLAEASPEAVKEFATWAKGRMRLLKQQASQHEDLYLRAEEEDYASKAKASKGKFGTLQSFQPNQLVMVKTPGVGAFGAKSKGPMLVLLEKGDSVKVKNILTNRVGWENKSNCLPLKATV